MIKVYKDWVITADENQYKVGTVVKITDKATGETKDSLKVDHYTGSIEQALKIILRVEKRRIAASEELTLEEALQRFKELTEDFESTINKIPFISER